MKVALGHPHVAAFPQILLVSVADFSSHVSYTYYDTDVDHGCCKSFLSTLSSKSTHKRVCRRIVGLAHIADDAGHGGEKYEKVKTVPLEELVKILATVHLRLQHT